VKLLLDQNLSYRLCRLLTDVFPGTDHVKAAGLDRASDEVIWEFARQADFAIVTLDSDFADIAALRGSPPKIVWLRCGNQSTETVAHLLRERAMLLTAFEHDLEATCFELY
jgi:predicted nuclease of predicted toxin-antitoxin system